MMSNRNAEDASAAAPQSPPQSTLTGSSRGTAGEADFVYQHNGLHLDYAPFGLEKIYDYEPGGHHPVHLGDCLGDAGKYRVLHKLGNGGAANVWLCRVTTTLTSRYVAVKILVSDTSGPDCPELLAKTVRDLKAASGPNSGADFICVPMDDFTLEGPNGSHTCFVYPVLGPRVSLGILHKSPDLEKILRKAALQVVEGVGFLHKHGICHGDLTAANVLHRISSLDGLSEAEVLKALGEPRRNPVLSAQGTPHDVPGAPQYLVYPARWADVETQYVDSDVVIIDFGEAFRVSEPPEDIGTPGPYRSPELLLDLSVGMSCDIWALGCTLFAIRTGRLLFDLFDDEDDAYLEEMVHILGKLPEPWWSSTWKCRKSIFKDEVDENGDAISLRVPYYTTSAHRSTTVHPSFVQNPRSLSDKIRGGVRYMADDSPRDASPQAISEGERDLFADLLNRIMVYDPQQRADLQEIAKHGWFHL